MKKIAVVGTGYVGLSNAVLLASHHDVVCIDIDIDRVNLINSRISPIVDNYIEKRFAENNLKLVASLDYEEAYQEADYIIIATPTNYNPQTNYFDTSSIELVLSNINKINNLPIIIIKSTIPVGFTEKMKKQFPALNIIFSPEFLREGKALYDNLYPSRIVIGDTTSRGILVGNLFKDAALNKEIVQVLQMNSTEAEAVKLFSNTYLAMRVAFFNELDSYCVTRNLNSKDIIKAVCLDSRIGDHYNNPSFGYGGYCLPKDTKQLLANYQDVPQNLISAIIKSNSTRKDFITEQILLKKPRKVGIYRLIMKSGSDNFRESAIQGIIKRLLLKNIDVVIYEPQLTENQFNGCDVVRNFEEFIDEVDLILANRKDEKLDVVDRKIFTRDVFGEN